MAFQPTIAVIGSGVAARTAALALSFQGFANVELFCQGPKPNVNRGLGIWPAARKHLESTGVQLTENSYSIPSAAYRNQSGDWLSRPPRDYGNFVRSIEQDKLIHLVNLQSSQVMRDEEFATMVMDDEWKLSTPSGKKAFDFYVLADGLHSHNREVVGGKAPTATPRWTTSSIVDNVSIDLPFETLHGSKRMAVIPLGRRRAFWFATCWDNEKLLTKESLLTTFGNLHEPLRNVIEQSAEEEYLLEQSYDCGAHPVNLIDDRIAMIGDCAHVMPPNLAQGASLAIEDAFELASALRSCSSGDAKERQHALKAWSSERILRVQRARTITAFTEMLSQMGHPVLETARSCMKFVPDPLNSSIFALALRYSFGKNWTL